MPSLSLRATVRATAALALLSAGSALANVGTGLPLDQYNPGTEIVNTSIVNNGNFEAVTAGVPNGWTQQNSFGVGPAIGPNSQTTGSSVAQGPFAAADPTFPAINGYTQSITLVPNTTYVLSGYMWNFGSNFDLIGAEVRDPAGNAIGGASIFLTRQDASAQDPGLILDGSRGVFGFSGFNSGPLSGNHQLIVKFDEDSAGDPIPNIGGQIDNVWVTPVTQFRPIQVPEPAGLGLAAVAASALLRRGRR